jgi:uncharacterized protein
MLCVIRDIKEGINEFERIVPSQDYDLSESRFYPNKLTLNIFIDRLENLFRFKITVSTKAVFTCDRCLAEFDSDFCQKIEQIYQLGSGGLESDEIEILPHNTKEIDISQAIRDIFILNRPIQLLCKEECKGLCVHCGANLNDQTCDCHQEKIDPRLEKLKSLLK